MEDCDVDTESMPCLEGLRRYGLTVLLPAAAKQKRSMTLGDIEHAKRQIHGTCEQVNDAVDWLKRIIDERIGLCVQCGLPFKRAGKGDQATCSIECKAQLRSREIRMGFKIGVGHG